MKNTARLSVGCYLCVGLAAIILTGCDAVKWEGSDGGVVTNDPAGDPDATTTNSSSRNRLLLEAAIGESGPFLTLTHFKPSTTQGPRVAEIRLALSSDLTFVSAQAGSALNESGKELITQVDGNGVIRLVAVSASSVSEIGSGVLATVTVKRKGTGPSTAEILLDSPLFAPAVANEGLLVDGKVTF